MPSTSSNPTIGDVLISLNAKANISDVYTRTEILKLLKEKLDISAVYDNATIDDKLNLKADKNSVIDKATLERDFCQKKDYFDKNEVQSLLDSKLPESYVYTIDEINKKLDKKSNKTDVYTKREIVDLFNLHGLGLPGSGGAVGGVDLATDTIAGILKTGSDFGNLVLNGDGVASVVGLNSFKQQTEKDIADLKAGGGGTGGGTGTTNITVSDPLEKVGDNVSLKLDQTKGLKVDQGSLSLDLNQNNDFRQFKNSTNTTLASKANDNVVLKKNVNGMQSYMGVLRAAQPVMDHVLYITYNPGSRAYIGWADGNGRPNTFQMGPNANNVDFNFLGGSGKRFVFNKAVSYMGNINITDDRQFTHKKYVDDRVNTVKSSVDQNTQNITTLQGQIANKADIGASYTKNESDAKYPLNSDVVKNNNQRQQKVLGALWFENGYTGRMLHFTYDNNEAAYLSWALNSSGTNKFQIGPVQNSNNMYFLASDSSSTFQFDKPVLYYGSVNVTNNNQLVHKQYVDTQLSGYVKTTENQDIRGKKKFLDGYEGTNKGSGEFVLVDNINQNRKTVSFNFTQPTNGYINYSTIEANLKIENGQLNKFFSVSVEGDQNQTYMSVLNNTLKFKNSTKIKNVSDGVEATDAINKNQFDNVVNPLTQDLNTVKQEFNTFKTNVVKLEGNQTINGKKTFTDIVRVKAVGSEHIGTLTLQVNDKRNNFISFTKDDTDTALSTVSKIGFTNNQDLNTFNFFVSDDIANGFAFNKVIKSNVEKASITDAKHLTTKEFVEDKITQINTNNNALVQDVNSLKEQVKKLQGGITLIGVIGKSRDEVNANKDTLLDAFVQQQFQREKQSGDVVITNDGYDFYYSVDHSGQSQNAQWVDTGEKRYNKATNTELGVVKGDAATDGKINISGDGTMTVNGFSTLKQKVDTNATQIALKADKSTVQQISDQVPNFAKKNENTTFTQTLTINGLLTASGGIVSNEKSIFKYSATDFGQVSIRSAKNNKAFIDFSEGDQGSQVYATIGYIDANNTADFKFISKKGAFYFDKVIKCDIDKALITDNKHLTTKEFVEDKIGQTNGNITAQLANKADKNVVESNIQKITSLETKVGTLGNLTTANKHDLISAINELVTKIETLEQTKTQLEQRVQQLEARPKAVFLTNGQSEADLNDNEFGIIIN